MEAIIKSISEIQNKHNNKINFSLLNVLEYRKTFNQKDEKDEKDEKKDPECGICYRHISNKVFVCAKPCAKTFHPACLERMIDRIEETTDDHKHPCYQCCYCRREFNISHYDTSLFNQELLYSKGCGYYVDDAILLSSFNSVIYDNEDIRYQYSIYIPVDTTYIKKPKQAKRAEFINKNNNKNKRNIKSFVQRGKGRR